MIPIWWKKQQRRLNDVVWQIAKTQRSIASTKSPSFTSSKFSTTTHRGNNHENRNYNHSTTTDFDVLIVGGGVVGTALARQLQSIAQQQQQQLTVGLVDVALTMNKMNPSLSDVPHPRSYALSFASLRLLGLHKNADDSEKDCTTTIDHTTTRSTTTVQATTSVNNLRLYGGSYDSMQVWEQDQPASLLWTAKDVSADTTYLGRCVEDAVLSKYLWNELEQVNTKTTNTTSITNPVSLFGNTTLQNIQWPSYRDGWVHADLVANNNNNAVDHCDPIAVRSRLLVIADGATSSVRQQAGIAMQSLEYGQSALTCTVELSNDMPRRAFQRFLTTGPLALLPTWSPRHAVVVWTTTPHEATMFAHPDTPPEQLTERLCELLQSGPEPLESLFNTRHNNNNNNNPIHPSQDLWNQLLYGVNRVVDTVQYGAALLAQEQDSMFVAPPMIERIVSPRLVFPLRCQWPVQSNYTAHHHSVVLVGDAAHTVHPLAGQGLNLGLHDVAALTACISKAVQCGMSITTFLDAYSAGRWQQVGLTMNGIHGLQRLFAMTGSWAKHSKAIGMSMVQNVGPVRRLLAQTATQGVTMP